MTDSSISTSPTLLQLAREHDPAAWDQLVYIYTPKVLGWCRRCNLQGQDVENVYQEVFATVFSKIQKFKREQSKHSFRGWLYTITRNKIIDHHRQQAKPGAGAGGTNARQVIEGVVGNQIVDELPESEPATSGENDDEKMSDPVTRAMEMIKLEFEEKTWKAFWAIVVEGRKPKDVAADMGLSTSAVYKAKSRVLLEFRARYDGLLDELATS